MKDMLTIRLKKKVVIKPGQPLYLKDISRLDSAREEIACKVKDLIIYDPQVQHGSFYVIDVMDVMDIIHKHFPALECSSCGACRKHWLRSPAICSLPFDHICPDGDDSFIYRFRTGHYEFSYGCQHAPGS